jgi:hypothetical protein
VRELLIDKVWGAEPLEPRMMPPFFLLSSTLPAHATKASLDFGWTPWTSLYENLDVNGHRCIQKLAAGPLHFELVNNSLQRFPQQLDIQ